MDGDLFQEISIPIHFGEKVGNNEAEVEKPSRWSVWCLEGEMFSVKLLMIDYVSMKVNDEHEI